jgi:hypothetical protein
MKYPFRSILIIASCTIAVFFTLTYISCRKDKCQNVTCNNGGICDGGVCFCPTGYGGPLCDTAFRDKFTGNWTVFQKGSVTEAAQYPVSILPAGDPANKVLIKNFDNYFKQPVVGYVSSDSLVIPRQALQAKIVQGAGFYDSNTGILMQYEITDSLTGTTTAVNTTWNL